MSGREDLVAEAIHEHSRNEVIEPDHRPGGSLSRTRVKCNGDRCDFYGVYNTWFLAVEAHNAHLTTAVLDALGDDESEAQR